MTAPTASPRARSYAPLLALAVPLGCLVWAFWSTLADLAQTWNTNPQYSHGFLVPVFAGVLLWLRRGQLDLSAVRPSLWGFALLAIALLLRLAGAYWHFISLDSLSLVPCVAGLVLLLGGWWDPLESTCRHASLSIL